MCISGSILGRRNSNYQDPKIDAYQVCSRNSKDTSVAVAENQWGDNTLNWSGELKVDHTMFYKKL